MDHLGESILSIFINFFQVDKATSDLGNTSVRLKDTVNQLRSNRNLCIDIILLCLILGIAAYLHNVLKK